LFDDIVKGDPIDVLHGDDDVIAMIEKVFYLADIAVAVKECQFIGLLLKSLHESGIGQYLENYFQIGNVFVYGQIDLSHTAGADFFQHSVIADILISHAENIDVVGALSNFKTTTLPTLENN
jgi:hypothetical protein